MFRHSEIQALLRERRREQQRRLESLELEAEGTPENQDQYSEGNVQEHARDSNEYDAQAKEGDDSEKEYMQFLKKEQEELKKTKRQPNTRTRRETGREVEMDTAAELQYDDDINENANSPTLPVTEDSSQAEHTDHAKRPSTSNAKQPKEDLHAKRRKLLVYSSDHEDQADASSAANAPSTELNRKREFIWPKIGGGAAGENGTGMA